MQSTTGGYKSRLWKYVYIDGVEQSKEILHTDTYNAPRRIEGRSGGSGSDRTASGGDDSALVETTPVEPTPVETDTSRR